MMNKIILAAILILVNFCGSVEELAARDFSVNTKGTGLFQIKSLNNKLLVVENDKVSLSDKDIEADWRKTNLHDGYFFLDFGKANPLKSRLRATSYLGVNLTTQGIEGRNDDVRWKIIKLDGDKVMLQHKSSGRLLCNKNDSVYLTDDHTARPDVIWNMKLKKLDLRAIQSPRILMGDDRHGFRDPAVIKYNGTFYMYYSFVKTEEDEKIYWYVAMSKSEDLVSWSAPKILTVKDQNKNFASPGDVIRFGNQWILCMTSYVMPGYTRKDPLRFGNKDCRLWIMRSSDLEHWSAPEMLEVKGPGIDPGSMIDPYLVEDKDEKGKWWVFFKQKTPKGNINYSYSYDLKTWHYQDATRGGENTCVWVEDDEYYLMDSPKGGMEILRSSDLEHWKVFAPANSLGKNEWWWASQRVTAGFVMDLRNDPTVGKYVMFFHGQGPPPKSTEIINSGTDIGIAWSDDLKHWDWPGKL